MSDSEKPNGETGDVAGGLSRASTDAGTIEEIILRLWPDLTPRERDIAFLLVNGQPIAELAATAFVSPSTVKFHITSILRKTGSRDTRELLARIIETLAAEVAASRFPGPGDG